MILLLFGRPTFHRNCLPETILWSGILLTTQLVENDKIPLIYYAQVCFALREQSIPNTISLEYYVPLYTSLIVIYPRCDF